MLSLIGQAGFVEFDSYFKPVWGVAEGFLHLFVRKGTGKKKITECLSCQMGGHEDKKEI